MPAFQWWVWRIHLWHSSSEDSMKMPLHCGFCSSCCHDTWNPHCCLLSASISFWGKEGSVTFQLLLFLVFLSLSRLCLSVFFLLLRCLNQLAGILSVWEKCSAVISLNNATLLPSLRLHPSSALIFYFVRLLASVWKHSVLWIVF